MFNKRTALAVLATASSASAQSCSADPTALVGFGASTTGGGSSAPVVVSDCAALQDAVKAGGVIQVSGLLEGCETVRLTSDTTLEGVGAGAGFTGTTIRINKVDNIIVRNLDLSLAPDGGDLIDIETSTQIWVDHCDLHNLGIEGDKDAFDGLLDAKRGSDFITVSWNKFYDHWKGTLIGHSASNGGQDEGKLHITYHHNSFTNINSRLPSIRFGTGHIFSNCYRDNPTSGINSREGAQVLVEGNYFENTRRAIVTSLDADLDGFAVERDNVYVNSDIDITQVGSLEVDYQYDVTAADSACACVDANAGAGKL